MSFNVAMFEFLSDQTGLTAIVDDRFYPTRLPEGAKIPAVTWFRVSAERMYTFDPFPDTDAWVKARVQFDCWETTAEKAAALGDQIVLALSGFDGDMGGQVIGASTVVNEIDTYETPATFYRRIVDVIVSYQETTETLEGSDSS